MIRKIHVLYAGILIQLLSVQSILMFNLFNSLGYWEAKTFLHPIGFALVIIYFLMNKGASKTLPAVDVLLLAYFIIFIILTLNINQGIESIYLTFRENIWAIVLISVYNKLTVGKIFWNGFLYSSLILVIANISAVLVNFYIGYEEYMELVTGRFVWGNDEEYKFKISFFYNLIRSPGLIGESASLGFFGLFTYFLFTQSKDFKKYKYFPILLTALSFTRSVYLSLLLLITYRTLSNYKVLRFIIKYVWALAFLSILLIIFLINENFFSFESLLIRIKEWGEKTKFNYNYIFGGKLGMTGSSVRGSGLAVLDSFWITKLLNFGLLGVILIVFFIKSKIVGNKSLKVFVIALAISGFFVTLTQSIAFLVFFPLLFLNTVNEFNQK